MAKASQVVTRYEEYRLSLLSETQSFQYTLGFRGWGVGPLGLPALGSRLKVYLAGFGV